MVADVASTRGSRIRGNRRARFFAAAGSASEGQYAVKLAVKWGYVATLEFADALALLDGINAMLWRLTHWLAEGLGLRLTLRWR